MKQNSVGVKTDLGPEKNGKFAFINFNMLSSSATKTSQNGLSAELSKMITRLTKLGDGGAKGGKTGGGPWKNNLQLRQLFGGARSYSTSDSCSSGKKFSHLWPSRKTSAGPATGCSVFFDDDSNRSVAGEDAEKRRLSTSDVNERREDANRSFPSTDGYCEGSYLPKRRKGVRKGFRSKYTQSNLSVHIEDDPNFDLDPVFDVSKETNSSEGDAAVATAAGDTTLVDVDSSGLECLETTLCPSEDLSTSPQLGDRADILRRKFASQSKDFLDRSEFTEDREGEIDPDTGEMKKVRVYVDLKKDSSPQRMQPIISLNPRDDPRKTIFDPVGSKRHSVCQSGSKQPDISCFLSLHGSHDDVADAASFRSSLPVVANRPIKGDPTTRCNGNSHNNNNHHYHHLQSKECSVGGNLSKPENGGGDGKGSSPERREVDSINSIGPNSELEGRKSLTRADPNNPIRFRDMRDARRKFFESESSLRSFQSNLEVRNPNNPLARMKQKSIGTLSTAASSRSPPRGLDRHSADMSRHRLFLSQLNYEPKLLLEEEDQRNKSPSRPEKFDKRVSVSMTTVNGDVPGVARAQDERQKISAVIPIRHHRKRESLDSGFDMKMEEAAASYPASEDSLTSVSSPDSYYRLPAVFSPPHAKTLLPGTAPVSAWFASSPPKLFYDPKEAARGGCVYNSHSVSTTTFSCHTTKRTFSTLPRNNPFPTPPVFQLAEGNVDPLVESICKLSDELRSVEMQLIGYAVAIAKSHERSVSSSSSPPPEGKGGRRAALSPALLSSYIPRFLCAPQHLSCFHVKEFFPKFFLDKFPWQPLSCYCFEDNTFNKNDAGDCSTAEDGGERDGEEEEKEEEEGEEERLDYQEIRSNLEELTVRQLQQLEQLREFLDGRLKTSKEEINKFLVKIQAKVAEKEAERCQNFASETEKILKLLIFLSQRISKHLEEASNSHPTNEAFLNLNRNETLSPLKSCLSRENQDKKNTPKRTDPKLSELETKLADARHLKDSIERRGMLTHEILLFRDLDPADVRVFFRSTGEIFVLPLLLLWVVERSKKAGEFVQGLDKIASDESVLTRQREKKRRKKKMLKLMKNDDDDDVDGDEEGDDDGVDDDDEHRL